MSRHSAPTTANFDGANDLAAYNNATALAGYGSSADVTYGFADGFKDRVYEWAADFVNVGYMPMDPTVDVAPGPPDGIIDDYVDAADLSATKKSQILTWALQGAPYAAATVSTSSVISKTETSAFLRASFNPNVHSGTAVEGELYFDYGLTASYGSTSSISYHTGTSAATQSIEVLGLECGKQYFYRARGSNGSGSVTGSGTSFTTDACTPPVMAGVSIVADATSQSTNEDTSKDFALTVTDSNYPGSLQWSKTNGSNGTVAILSSTSTAYSGSASVRYTPALNYYGSDSFTVTVINMQTLASQVVTFNMTVSAQNNDAPVISATSTINNNEDGVNAADGTPTAIAVSLSALDPDVSPGYHWDVTSSNDGTPIFSVATGAVPTLTYTPGANDYGSPADTFTVRVCDGGSAGTGNCDSQVFTVNLTAQPDTPTAVTDTGVNVLEGASSTLLSVVGNDIDPDAGEQATLVPDLASLTVMTAGTGLTITGVSGNKIEVAHDGREGDTTVQLSYKVKDSTGRVSAAAATVNVTIQATDDPPTSADLNVASSVNEGTTATIDLVAISNDPESAAMAVCNTLTAPTSGNASVSIIPSGPDAGKVLYTHNGTDVPAVGLTQDTFTYQVNDANDSSCSSGNNSGFSTVTLTLSHVNDAPVAVTDSISVAEGGTVTTLVGGNTTVLQNDTDEENGTGAGFTVSGNTTPGFNSGFSLNADGTFSYTHNSSENFSTSFTYTVNDGATDSVSPGTVNITVIPVNDAPLISSVAPTPALVFTEQAPANVYQVTQSDVDDSAFTYSLGATGLAGDMPAGNMVISATGLITWTPPRTGVFNQATAMVTVTVSDVDSSSAGTNILSDVQSFMVATRPVDTDNDGVADYSDNCPTVANAGQEDLDNDTVHILPQTDPSGIPANGDVDPTARDAANLLAQSYLKGGNACDEDADGDGMSNDFENNYTFLDPLNASDAAADEDGDGISNLDEFLASTAPDEDSVGPMVNAPADVSVDATGFLTVVSLGKAVGNDGNDGASTLFKAAVDLTPAQLTTLDTPKSGCQAFSDYDTAVKPFRPGTHTVTWATCDSSGNSGRDSQLVEVRPLVSMTAGQSVGEGQVVTIEVVLNGDAIAYPATVDYTLTGTATAVDDHDGVAGTVTFNAPGDVGVISFNTLADGVVEADETVVVTLRAPVNVALSNARVHTVTITEDNLAPHVALNVTQPGAALDKKKGNTLYQVDGLASVVAEANDANGDTLTFDWSASDANLLAVATVSANQIDFDPNALAPGGFYKVAVTVSDGAQAVTAERLLMIKAAEANAWLIGEDSDGDGVDNLSEGYGDTDADGIPDYIDNYLIPRNVIANQTVNLKTSLFIETNPGLHIAQGETAVAAQASGILIGLQDIFDFGGAGGVAVSNAATDYSFIGSLLNFEISGLTDSIESVDVVIPLQSAIQAGSVYRKYNGSGWFDFVIDDKNAISSAAGSDGSCPQPGSNLYSPGLTAGNLCLQLTIQDGGANDADGVRNFVVKDPGGLAVAPEPEAVTQTSNDSGRVGTLNLWFMLLLSLAAVFSWRLRIS